MRKPFVTLFVGLIISIFAGHDALAAVITEVGHIDIGSVSINSQNKVVVSGTAGGGLYRRVICSNGEIAESPDSLSNGTFTIDGGSGGSGNPNLVITQFGVSDPCDGTLASENKYSFSFKQGIGGLSSGTHTVTVCADQSGRQICDSAPFTIAGALPRIGLSQFQVTIVCSSASCPTSRGVSVLNTQSQAGADMVWRYNISADSAKSLPNKFFSFINTALASGCSTGGFLSDVSGGLCGGSGLGSGESSGGSVGVISPTQTHHVGSPYNGTVTETCNPSTSCDSGFQSATLGVQYLVLSPSVTLTASGAGQSGKNITVPAGTSVTLSWSSANTNASSPVQSCSFGCSSAFGSQNIVVVSTTSHSITVKGISDIDTSGGNFDTDSVTINVTAPTPTPPPTPTPTPTPTPSTIPTVPTVTITEPNYCSSGPAGTVSWTYSDPSGDPQSAYQVQIDDAASFTSPAVDSGRINSTSRSYFSGQGSLAFDTTYRARVRVWDSTNAVSNWTTSSTWKTPKHAYPTVSFTNTPASPAVNQSTQFTDTTTFSDNTGIGQRAWSWLFGDGGSSSSQNPTHAYNATGSYTVTETVTDRDGYICSVSNPVNVARSIPTWREVSPK